jgi:hypothetical protein
MDAKIVYVLPSRQRPIAFFDTINNIIENSASDNYEIIATLDSDDESMNNSAVKASISTYPKVTAYWGKSHNKVHAINRECDKIPDDTDIVILVSDDQRYIIKGYDDLIRVEMNRNYPDKDGVLHFMDNTPARDKMITMSIMGYFYFKRFGFLYDPCFMSVYCDNQFTEISKRLGKYKLISNHNIYIHNHFVWGTAPIDDLYKRNEEPIIYAKDKETYFKNLSNNFGL